jgi:hypothetical protein
MFRAEMKEAGIDPTSKSVPFEALLQHISEPDIPVQAGFLL